FLGEPLDERSAIGDLALGFRERLALLGGEQQAPGHLVRHHQVEPLAQNDGALLRGLGTPRGPCAIRGFDRAPSLGSAHVGNAADSLAGRGFVYFERAARVGTRPRAIEVALLAEEAGISQGNGGESCLCGGLRRTSTQNT